MRRECVPQDNKISGNLKGIKHKIFVMSGKGGVGKSTIAANLAVALSKRGATVGLLDIDIHGPNIPKMFGLEEKRLNGTEKGIEPVVFSGIKIVSMGFILADQDTPVIWRGPMKMGVIRQFLGEVLWGELDYLVIDLPPGTGDEPLSIAQMVPDSDGAVVVTTPQEVALLDSRKSVRFAETLGVPILGIVENMSGFTCPHCGKITNIFKQGGGEEAARDLGVQFLGRIPLDSDIMSKADQGVSFVSDVVDSEASLAFEIVVKRIEERIREGVA